MKVFNLYFLILILSAGLNNLAQDWRKMSEEEINAFLRRIYGDRYSWFDKDYQDEEYELDALESAAKLLNDYEAKLTENVAASKPKKNKHRNKRKVVRVDKDEEDLDNAIILAEKERLLIDDEVNAEILSLKEKMLEVVNLSFLEMITLSSKSTDLAMKYSSLALDDESRKALEVFEKGSELISTLINKTSNYLIYLQQYHDLNDLKIKYNMILKFQAKFVDFEQFINNYKNFFDNYDSWNEEGRIKDREKCNLFAIKVIYTEQLMVYRLWNEMFMQLIRKYPSDKKLKKDAAEISKAIEDLEQEIFADMLYVKPAV